MTDLVVKMEIEMVVEVVVDEVVLVVMVVVWMMPTVVVVVAVVKVMLNAVWKLGPIWFRLSTFITDSGDAKREKESKD